MKKNSAQRWIVTGVLALVTISFLGVSIAPLITSLLPKNSQTPVANSAAVEVKAAETEKVKIQIEGFEAVLKREPKNETALKGIIDLRLRIRDFKGAIEPLTVLADANPQVFAYRKILARTKLETKDSQGALVEYQKVLDQNPTELESLQTMVSLQLADRKPEAAITVLNKSLEVAETQPANKPSILWILGNVYSEQKRYKEAVITYEKIAVDNPKDFRPFVGKAQIKRLEGKEAEAKTLFAEAAKLAPPEFKDKVNQLAETPIISKPPTP